MEFEIAFKKPFTNFKKLLIGILISILPIVNLFATGYLLQVAKSTIKKKKELPEWSGWGDLFVNGLIAPYSSFRCVWLVYNSISFQNCSIFCDGGTVCFCRV